MRKAMKLALVALMAISLCACAKTKDDEKPTATPAPTATPTPAIKAEQVNDPYGNNKPNTDGKTDSKSDATATATPAPTATPEPTEAPIDENDTSFKKSKMNLRILSSTSQEMSELDFDEMDELKYVLDARLVTFPSLNALEEDRFVEASSADELLSYINENNNIWKTADDVWVFQRTDFHHAHDYFYNISWVGMDDIHYFMVDLTTLLPTSVFEVDENKMFYNKDTKTLYLYFEEGLTYKTYVSQTDKGSAKRIEEEALTNRGILALNNGSDYEIEEIVLVKPFVLKR